MGLKYDARLDLSALSDALEKRGLTPGGRVQKAVDEIGTQVVAYIPRSGDIQRAEAGGGTVFECLAESPMHAVYNDLADRVLDMTQDEKGEQQVC